MRKRRSPEQPEWIEGFIKNQTKKQPFVKVHCAALPDTLKENELFGYEPGAFTGPSARKLIICNEHRLREPSF
jgi:transcriptional regulator of acetoin/glycerol metabolism